MAIRPVLEVPDSRLKQVSAPWEGSREAALALEADMIDTLRSFPGCVGLAAPQIGEMWRVIAVDVTGHKKAKSCHGLMILFNPEIVSMDGRDVAREGCLSLPDFTANVARATHLVLAARCADGSERVIEADAFEARALLHEVDHLDGLLFLDRVSSLQTDVFRRKTYK